ncbi:MAG: PQQ-dependent sugar dehydrogenase [Pyrinomonadaceae bacterium]
MPTLSHALPARLARVRYMACAVVALLFLACSTLRASTLPAGFTETLVASGITAPTAMAVAPDGRLFVCQQGGKVRVIKNGVLLPAPFLIVSTDTFVDHGLLGITFDPSFETNHYVYVYYTTASTPAHNRISRFTANGDVAAANSEVVIMNLSDLPGPGFHNGGALHFGEDGKLYIATGDGSNHLSAQSMESVFGKILRINKNGTIPTDNPFLSTTTGIHKAIWARGLRNPFSFAFQPGTGRMFINDVGQDAWEEINEGAAGANYGWPVCEGRCSIVNFTEPYYFYAHVFEGALQCAITGGTFYNPPSNQFPEEYRGDYLFADYCGGWIRRFNPVTKTVTEFAAGIAEPAALEVGMDGSLYYLSISEGAVYKIEYASSQPPGITTHPLSQTVTLGRPATFNVRASGATPIAYQWQKNGVNISGATTERLTLTASSVNNDARFRCLASNAFGSTASQEATLTVTTNTAPVGTINAPARGALYNGGQTVNYAGTATDREDSALPPSAFTWRVDFHHNTHTHPFVAPVQGTRNGSFTIPVVGEESTNVWYRIYLTVTDSGGMAHTSYRDLLPRKTLIKLATNPAGLQVSLDRELRATPFSALGVAGIARGLGVLSPQTLNGKVYEFDRWSDGGSATHDISVPLTTKTYTATFHQSGINRNAGVSYDFDGDRLTDVAVWRPGTGSWIISRSTNGTKLVQQWGNSTDTPVPSDYDGDGRTDLALFNDGIWNILKSSNGEVITRQLGMDASVPVPGDYDGDGKTDLAVFASNNWLILRSSDFNYSGLQWGWLNEDRPVLGDYDGDGRADIGVWRPSTGLWQILKIAGGAPLIASLGATGDHPVPADYDGDGKTDFAVFRPSTTLWTILRTSDGTLTTRKWGLGTDTLAPADYDGDGKADLAVWRPSNGTFYILKSSDGRTLLKKWGSGPTNDLPIPSVYLR